MKQSLSVACALLSGCALAGLEGPERQANAQQALRDFPGQLNRALEPGGSGDNTSDQLDQIRQQNQQIESDLQTQQFHEQQAEFNQRQWEQQQEWNQRMERLRNGEPP